MESTTIQTAVKTFLDSGEYGRGCYNNGKPCKTTLFFDSGFVSEDSDLNLFYRLNDGDGERVYLNPSNLGF